MVSSTWATRAARPRSAGPSSSAPPMISAPWTTNERFISVRAGEIAVPRSLITSSTREYGPCQRSWATVSTTKNWRVSSQRSAPRRSRFAVTLSWSQPTPPGPSEDDRVRLRRVVPRLTSLPASPRKAPGRRWATVPPDSSAEGHRAGEPGFRRASLAIFLAGVAVFAMLYATQVLLPELARSFGVSSAAATLSVSGATAGLSVGVVVLRPASGRRGRPPSLPTRPTSRPLLGGRLVGLS